MCRVKTNINTFKRIISKLATSVDKLSILLVGGEYNHNVNKTIHTCHNVSNNNYLTVQQTNINVCIIITSR